MRPAGSTIGWGILGAGAVAHGFASSLRTIPDARLVAISTRGRPSGRAFADRHGPIRVHERAEDLVQDPDVDVVYVATPNHCHADDVLLCLANDVPVLCEKPFTTDAARAHSVVAEARRRAVFCMEAMWMRFVPAVRRAVELLDAGAIGEIRTLHADFSIVVGDDPDDRRLRPDSGALLDLGVYALSLADLLLGPPHLVGAGAVMRGDVDESICVVSRHAGGRLGTSTASLGGVGPNRAVVAGSRGTLELGGPICRPTRLVVTGHPAPGGRRGSGGGRVPATIGRVVRRLGSTSRVERLPHRGVGYEDEAREVMRCLREGRTESAVMPLDATLRVMELVTAALERARSVA